MGNVRVRGHDYRGRGYYFITFGTLNRRHWLSRIVNGQVALEPAGELLMDAWHKIAEEDPAYELDVTAVMPDHFHGLAIARRAPRYVIGTHVSRVEGRVLHAMRKRVGDPGLRLWDEGFYDYLSLDMKMLRAFQNYIRENPARWQLRHDHPEWFRKQYALQHSRLPREITWTAYGDATLLNHPSLVPVIVSRKHSDDEYPVWFAVKHVDAQDPLHNWGTTASTAGKSRTRSRRGGTYLHLCQIPCALSVHHSHLDSHDCFLFVSRCHCRSDLRRRAHQLSRPACAVLKRQAR